MTEKTIEAEISRSGHGVVKKDGKWLASSFDPMREAKQWCDSVDAGSGVGGTSMDAIIVLGLGCGYHVAELRARHPQTPITVIECDAAVVKSARGFCPGLDPKSIVTESEWQKLVEHSAVRDALGGPFRVAKHAPSFAVEPEYFGAVDRLLRGRDKLSFLLLLKARPEILGLLDAEQLADAEKFPADEAFSIKTMQKLFAARPNTSRERRLWRVLEELVV